MLTLAPNITDPDSFFAELIAVHDGLSEAESHALTARLVLILANHIGDRDVLTAALHTARTSGRIDQAGCGATDVTKQ